MSPRPILKRSHSTEQHTAHYPSQHHPQFHHPPTHGVHFPPSPALTRTFSAYSASAYDRSPIVVSPNSCALPERGCPGRTYLLDEGGASPCQNPRGIAYARDYHPRALAFASANNACSNPAASTSSMYGPVPLLVPDLSSESDESDGFLPGEPPSASYHSYGHGVGNAKSYNNSMSMNGYTNAYGHNGYTPCDDNEYDNSPLRYKAYGAHSPPSASPMPHFPSIAEDTCASPQKSRRKSERRHESSRDPNLIRNGHGSDLGFAALSLSCSPPSPTTPGAPRKKGVRRHHQLSLPPPSDDGCLGGF